jgi:hypothetical protein
MPRNVSGVYLQPASDINPPVYAQPIDPVAFAAGLTDLGSEITNSLYRLGRAPMLADLPLGGFGIKASKDGSSAGPGLASENFTFSVASSPVSSGVASTMATLNLTAGRWIAAADCFTIPAAGVATQSFQFYLSSTDAGNADYAGAYSQLNVSLAANKIACLNFATGQVISSAAAFTLYFCATVFFTGGTMAVSGTGGAIRLP